MKNASMLVPGPITPSCFRLQTLFRKYSLPVHLSVFPVILGFLPSKFPAQQIAGKFLVGAFLSHRNWRDWSWFLTEIEQVFTNFCFLSEVCHALPPSL